MNPLVNLILVAVGLTALFVVYESQSWGGYAVIIVVLGMLIAAEGRHAI